MRNEESLDAPRADPLESVKVLRNTRHEEREGSLGLYCENGKKKRDGKISLAGAKREGDSERERKAQSRSPIASLTHRFVFCLHPHTIVIISRVIFCETINQNK